MWLWSPLSAGAETWPIKEFKVYKVNPSPWRKIDVLKAYTLSIKAGDDAQAAYDKEQADSANAPPISSDQISQIEKWLGVVAHEYERLGFKVPDYTDIDTSNNKKGG